MILACGITSEPPLAAVCVEIARLGVPFVVWNQRQIADLERLERIRCCPTQFQEFVEGTNVRVHVVGQRVFTTKVESEAIDYRYAHDQVKKAASLSATDLSDEISDQYVKLSRKLRLPLAGVDLKLAPDGRVYCFEVNPCPAFSYYEFHTGQPIARAIAEYLAARV